MKEELKEFVRDICSVGWHPKSVVRRRLNDILQSQRAELLEKIEGMKKAPELTGNIMTDSVMDGYNQALAEIIKLLK